MSSNANFLCFVRDKSLVSAVNGYCERNGLAGSVVDSEFDPIGAAESVSPAFDGVILLEVDPSRSDVMQRAEALCDSMSGARFVFVCEDTELHSIRRLFRAGALDVLPAPVNMEDLTKCLNSARNKKVVQFQPPRKIGKLVCMLKTAGGVGATTLAANLAHEFVGQNRDEMTVALVDFDVQFGAVASTLDLAPKSNLADAIEASDRLDSTLLRHIVVRHESGIHVLCSPSRLTPLSTLTPELVASLCDVLMSSFDIVIADMPMAWTQSSYQALEAANVLVPVFEPTVRSAEGAQKIADCLIANDLGDVPIFPVANKVKARGSTQKRHEIINSIFGAVSLAEVREDSKVVEKAADIGCLVSDVSAGAPAAKDIKNAARELADLLGLHATEQEKVRSDGARKFKLGAILPGGAS